MFEFERFVVFLVKKNVKLNSCSALSECILSGTVGHAFLCIALLALGAVGLPLLVRNGEAVRPVCEQRVTQRTTYVLRQRP
jgi:hypothetical protein